MIVRGPGVPAGRTLPHAVLNIDLAPTLAELGGAAIAPDSVDGLSFARLLGESPPALDAWRKDFLVEHKEPQPSFPSWLALRMRGAVFVAHASDEFEYYDLETDPDQIESRHASLSPSIQDELMARLAALRRCRGANCR
jgi:arylsulfatase A-like enzyme